MDEQMREKLGFSIDDASEDVRVLTYTSGACRPASSEEIALWDALAALSQPAAAEPLANRWIKWTGTGAIESPLPKGALVDLTFGDGVIHEGVEADAYWWWHTKGEMANCIVSFRIAKATP